MTTLQRIFLEIDKIINRRLNLFIYLHVTVNQFQRNILCNVVINIGKQGYSVFPRYEVVFQVNAHARGNSNKAYGCTPLNSEKFMHRVFIIKCISLNFSEKQRFEAHSFERLCKNGPIIS